MMPLEMAQAASAPSCCGAPKITPGAKFCRECGAPVAAVPAASPVVPPTQNGGYPPYVDNSTTSIAPQSSVHHENGGGNGAAMGGGGENPYPGYDPQAAWLEPRGTFDEDTQWEALPFERPIETRPSPGEAIACLMCGCLCSTEDTSCPECDNPMEGAGGTMSGRSSTETGHSMGGGSSGGGDDLQTSFPLRQTPNKPTLSRRSSVGSEVSGANSEASREGGILETLSDKVWYEGPMTRSDAEAMLATAESGSFLIRQRLNTEGLALAHKTAGKIRHYLVTEDAGHWRLSTGSPSPFFSSLDELVQYYERSTELGGVQLRPRRSDGSLVAVASAEQGDSALDDLERPVSVTIGAAQSPAFKKLANEITSSVRLFDLISLGNGILDAEENRLLYAGEIVRLRRSYRIRRSVLSYGCPKTAWQPNKDAKRCQNGDCSAKFSTTNRRHHCRSCGLLMCKACSSQRFERSGLKLAKVCPLCHEFLSEISAGRVKEAVAKYGPTFTKTAKPKKPAA